jgi:hypothetical protein
VLEISLENTFEVPPVPDQRPVQALGADGPNRTLRVGVRVRRPRRNLHPLHAGRGEHRIERRRELGVPVSGSETGTLRVPTIPSALVVAGLTSQQILFHRRGRGRPNSLVVDA